MPTPTEAVPIARSDNDNVFGESVEEISSFPISLADADVASGSSTDGLIFGVECLPVSKLCGECVEAFVDIIGGSLFLTNYRIIIIESTKGATANIPILSVESIETRDTCTLQIICKYGRVYKVTALNSESACEWFKKLSQKTITPRSVFDIFSWQFAKFAKLQATWLTFKRDSGDMESSAEFEFIRLGFNQEYWRISKANSKFELCETYPGEVIVPKAVSDNELRLAADARTLSRFPAAVWHCKQKGSVLMRSSQPRVGIFSYRYQHDEQLIECARSATPPDRIPSTMLIIDARSYTAALGNRAKGGGVEIPEYYLQTEVEYMNLPNIHNIRYAFHQLRTVLSDLDEAQFFQSLQATNWLSFILALIDAAHRCVTVLVDEGRSVLVHCSDGWDRTTQITTLAKIIADPYYRTIEGFRNLVRRDWIDFGHKFSDRLGNLNRDSYERSPVFLQWLDCVYQLHKQNPFAFQFSAVFLTKLALHTYSGLFGTFLYNSLAERKKVRSGIDAETLSVWSYLDDGKPEFINLMYKPRSCIRLRSRSGLINLVLWKELYLCPDVEQTINEPENKNLANAFADGFRTSLYRAHSAESLSNVDAINHSSCSSMLGGKLHAVGTQSSLSADCEKQNEDSEIDGKSESHSTLEERFAKQVDVDGLTKTPDLIQEGVRNLIEKLMREKDDTIRKLEEENKRLIADSRNCLNSSAGDPLFPNGSPTTDPDRCNERALGEID